MKDFDSIKTLGTAVEKKHPLACVLSEKSEIYVVLRSRLAQSRAGDSSVVINIVRPSDYFCVL